MDWWAILIIVIVSIVAVVLALSFLTSKPRFILKDKVVVITGGSSGIGKAAAQELLLRGANVALIARRLDILEDAKKDLTQYVTRVDQKLTIHTADVAVEESTVVAMEDIAKQHGGRIDAIICSAGISHPNEFVTTPASQFEQVLKVNVLGTRNAIYTAVPYMAYGEKRIVDGASKQQSGRIVLVSSQAGQVGLYGYTAYSSSKFALQGFMQSLSMELHNRNIAISLSFPPDTDTPLFSEENKTKPVLTKLLSESTSCVTPDVVAKTIVDGMEWYNPYMTVGFEGWILAQLTAGMGPVANFGQGAVQVLTMGLWRFVSFVIRYDWYRKITAHSTHK